MLANPASTDVEREIVTVLLLPYVAIVKRPVMSYRSPLPERVSPLLRRFIVAGLLYVVHGVGLESNRCTSALVVVDRVPIRSLT